MTKEKDVYVFTKNGTIEKVSTKEEKIFSLEDDGYLVFQDISMNNSHFQARTKQLALDVVTLTDSISIPLPSINPDKGYESFVNSQISSRLKHGKVVDCYESFDMLSRVYVSQLSYSVHPENPLSSILERYKNQDRKIVELEKSLKESVRKLGGVKCNYENLLAKYKESADEVGELKSTLNNPKFSQIILMFWFWITNIFNKQ